MDGTRLLRIFSSVVVVVGSRGGGERRNGIECGSQFARSTPCAAVPWPYHSDAQCTRSADKVGLWRQHVQYDERFSRQSALLPYGGNHRAESEQPETVSSTGAHWLSATKTTNWLQTLYFFLAWGRRWERSAPTVMNPCTIKQKWQVSMRPQSEEMPARNRWPLSIMRCDMQRMDLLVSSFSNLPLLKLNLMQIFSKVRAIAIEKAFRWLQLVNYVSCGHSI